ncbi:MAG: serine/threonine protein kinase [Planctomycetes bacterium]|nr:serine/threonine protein kinase [Planctomycetota bacterium]
MSSAPWEKVRSLFEEALRLPETEREKFLRGHPHIDPTALREVQSLLAAHREDEFLETPAFGPARTWEDLEFCGEGEPREVGPYRLGRLLGAGASALVYEARHRESGAEVALKVLRSRARSSARQALALLRESRALARVQHPGVAAVLDAGTTAEGLRYVAMELVRGRTLDRFIATEKPTTRQRLELFRQLLEAVEHAHGARVVHRDLKPGNVMVVRDAAGIARVKVLDFGLAKLLEQAEVESALATESGAISGTLAYMSPEQAAGRADGVGPASDVYSLGVLFFELLAGRLPYRASVYSPAGLLRAIERERPAALPPTSSPALGAIVAKCLEKSPRLRYKNAKELRADLERAMAGRAPLAARDGMSRWVRRESARHRRTVAAAAALSLAFLGGWAATDGPLRGTRTLAATLRLSPDGLAVGGPRASREDITQIVQIEAPPSASGPHRALFAGWQVPGAPATNSDFGGSAQIVVKAISRDGINPAFFDHALQPVFFEGGVGAVDLTRHVELYQVDSPEKVQELLRDETLRRAVAERSRVYR